jgi:lactoylglutathione lyase
MELAKPCIDVGVFTDALEDSLRFWQEDVGLSFEELLPTGGGNHQHRHGMNGSVLKLNHPRAGLPEVPPGGYRALRIARPGLGARRTLHDPHGSVVHLVPPGEDDVTGIAVHVAVRDPAAQRRFYLEGLGLTEIREDVYRCGESLLVVEADPGAAVDRPIAGRGFRYLTIQIRDCAAVHAGVLARGGRERTPPRRLGDVAIMSMVADPDGNWIELSQRASLTGPLG